MTSNEFAYWLQGFAELNGAPPTAEQWQSIQDHLKLVFVKVTPMAGGQASSQATNAWLDEQLRSQALGQRSALNC